MPAEVSRPPNPSSKTTKGSARAPVAKNKANTQSNENRRYADHLCGVDLIGCGVCAIIRDYPDDARTNIAFSALRQDGREVRQSVTRGRGVLVQEFKEITKFL